MATTTTSTARPWQVMEEEDTPGRAYWQHFRDGVNTLHPSCNAAANATPTLTEEAMVEEQDHTIRVVTYREDRGRREGREEGRNSRRETRGDRERRRGMAREEGRRDRNRRDQERAREADRRQRDRGDRANKERQGPKRN